MQQIELYATTGGYDWAKATNQIVGDAETGDEHGMLINLPNPAAG
jgi:hypothetical protein